VRHGLAQRIPFVFLSAYPPFLGYHLKREGTLHEFHPISGKTRIKRARDPDMQMPLNSVDMGLLALGSIGECARHHWILDTRGDVERDLLEAALLSTLSVYPIMRSRLYIRRFRPWRRSIEAVPGTMVQYLDLSESQNIGSTKETQFKEQYDRVIADWMDKPFALDKELPVRVLLVKKGQTEFGIIFTFAHSSVDGIRGLRFVRRVLESYGRKLSTEPYLPEYVRLRRHDELFEFARKRRAEVKGFYRKILFSLFRRFIVEPFRPPARIFHDRSGTSAEIGYCAATLDVTELRQIQSQAKAARVSMNDILLAACFKTIDTWNNMHGKSSRKIRIMVPVDLGPPDFRDLISNQIGFVSLSLMPRDRAEPAVLLQKVSTEMSSMLRDGIAFWLVYFSSMTHYLPMPATNAIARFLILTRIYIDTVVFSNVGIVGPENGEEYNLGTSRIVDMRLIMPIVTPQGLSILVYTYNNRLYITIAYKAGLFSKEKAQMFLDYYVAELRNYPVAGSV
jgi:NRPS condensation-like uncharacterized protein